jgi:hypothetical protein
MITIAKVKFSVEFFIMSDIVSDMIDKLENNLITRDVFYQASLVRLMKKFEKLMNSYFEKDPRPTHIKCEIHIDLFYALYAYISQFETNKKGHEFQLFYDQLNKILVDLK